MSGTPRRTNAHLYAKLNYDPLREPDGNLPLATSGNVLIRESGRCRRRA